METVKNCYHVTLALPDDADYSVTVYANSFADAEDAALSQLKAHGFPDGSVVKDCMLDLTLEPVPPAYPKFRFKIHVSWKYRGVRLELRKHAFSASFRGPHQLWIFSFTKEWLDSTGEVTYATPLYVIE